MVEGIDIAIENLKSQLLDLKQRLSQCRKKGVETTIADLKLTSVPSKIRMVEVTRNLKDVQKAASMLNDAKTETEELEKQAREAKGYQPDEDEESKAMSYLLEELEDRVKRKEKDEAAKYYMKCFKLYSSMKPENKKKVFNKLNELRMFIT